MNRATPSTGWARNPDGTLGWTWNPITGCLNGCEYCYARKLANGRLKTRYLANDNVAKPIKGGCLDVQALNKALQDPFYPRFWEDRLLELQDMPKNRGVFVCDMSDLFGIGIPEDWTRQVLREIECCDDSRFYLLTKQPQNLIKFSPFPDNCWVGVTATGHDSFIKALRGLMYVQATVKFLSIEPFLKRIMLPEFSIMGRTIQQVIIGAQTKPYKPPQLAWVEEIIFACVKAGIPYFLKDNLAPIIPGHTKGDKLKQEMPVCQKPQ